MTLDDLIPGWSAAKLIAVGIGALLAAAALAWGFFTVKGWHDDAAKLPAVRAQLETTTDAYAVLDTLMTRKLNAIAGQLDANDARRAAAEQRVIAGQAGIDGQVQAFLRRYADAVPHNPACVEPFAVRDGLLHLFPLAPAEPGAVEGGRGGGEQTGSSRAPAVPPLVPERQPPAVPGGHVGMSPAAGRAGRAAARHPAGAARAADRGVAGRSQSPVRAAELRMAPGEVTERHA